MNISTSTTSLQIPQVASSITLNGRQSKLIVADYAFGTSRLLYSTAQVFFAGKIGSRDVVFLYGDSDQEHEAALSLKGTPRPQILSTNIPFTRFGVNHTIVNLLAGIRGLITIWDSDQQLVLFSDTDTAGTFWSPVIVTDTVDTFKHYWQIGSNTSILVGGPYLVRSASIRGSELELRGDLKDDVRLTVIGPSNIRSIKWNGIPVAPDVSARPKINSLGVFTGQLRTKERATAISVPTLSHWKFADSLPEIREAFSDKKWTVANHTRTNIPFRPHYTDGRILYGCDYQL
jgi:Beta-galactosidase, domain 2/Beta-galactosidase, domain 3